MSGQTVLLGDFNSITDCTDRVSGNLDPISGLLSNLLSANSLVEPNGTHHFSFTYHYPSLNACKSRLNHIYINFLMDSLHGYCQYVSFSDHYLVSLFKLPDSDKGLVLWRLSSDMLANQGFVDYMNCQLLFFDYKNPVDSWERLKLCAQHKVQNLSKFRLKQQKYEISALHSTLKYINKQIFLGESLDHDRLLVQTRIEQHCDHLCFFSFDSDSLQWIVNEGKMVCSFLHLKDVKNTTVIKELKYHGGSTSGSKEIIPVLHTFYSHLYEMSDVKTDSEILEFLTKIDSLPRLIENLDSFLGPIGFEEIEAAIKKLHPNKSPGLDGLPAEFYQYFAQQISPILEAVFNQVFVDKRLSFTQCVAIITLLFKKGDPTLVGNYRPISLTNCDYKILAYVLTAQLSTFLPSLIHPSQSLYMESCFIGTNVHSVQDMIDHNIQNNTDGLVLFLDFCKAFDSVSHQFLFTLLEFIGLPAEFVQWIHIMYSEASSCVKYNNWLTPLFPLGRGVCQGCPLSCHLFNLVGQVLVYSLHHVGFHAWWHFPSDPCSLYANDGTLFVESMAQLPGIIKHSDSW